MAQEQGAWTGTGHPAARHSWDAIAVGSGDSGAEGPHQSPGSARASAQLRRLPGALTLLGLPECQPGRHSALEEAAQWALQEAGFLASRQSAGRGPGGTPGHACQPRVALQCLPGSFPGSF